jgi:small GTP-binding protein
MAVADAIREAAGAVGDCPAARTCDRLLARLAEDRFELVVLGQFTRGKSTLINAILGTEILPTGTLPLTSVVTALRHGERPRALIRRAGHLYPEEVPVSRLGEFLTEKGNPGNAKGVLGVDVEVPAPFLRRGLRLVDTPGVGSIHERNTGMTYAYLPEVDAAVFVTSVESPLGQTETEFLDAIRQHVRKVFLVLNKVDQLDPDARDEVLAFTEDVLARQLGIPGARVFPVSARQALQAKRAHDGPALEASGLPSLERALATFLDTERRSAFLVALLDRADKALEAERGERELRRKAVEDPRGEAGRLGEFRRRVATLRDEWRGEMDRVRQRAEDWRRSWLRPRLEAIGAAARSRPEGRGRREPAVRDELVSALGQQAEGWGREHARAAEALARELGTACMRRLAESLQQVAREAAAVVGQPLSVDEPDLVEWTPPRCPEGVLHLPELLADAGPLGRSGWLGTRRGSRRRLAAEIARALDAAEAHLVGYVADCVEALDAASSRAWTVEAERVEARLTGPPSGREDGPEAVARLQQRIARLRFALLEPAASAGLEWDGAAVERSPGATDEGRPLSAPGTTKETAAGPTACVVCRVVVQTTFDMLCHQQYALAVDAGARRIFLASGGWCPPHLWQLAALASPRGLCSALPSLVEQVAERVSRLAGLPGHLAARRIADLVPDQGRCPACALRARVEQDAARALVDDLNREGSPRDGLPILCVPHVHLLLTGLGDHATRAVLEDMGRRMTAIAESMEGYALKVDARRRDLLTRAETTAHRDAVEVLAGLKHLLAPMQGG